LKSTITLKNQKKKTHKLQQKYFRQNTSCSINKMFVEIKLQQFFNNSAKTQWKQIKNARAGPECSANWSITIPYPPPPDSHIPKITLIPDVCYGRKRADMFRGLLHYGHGLARYCSTSGISPLLWGEIISSVRFEMLIQSMVPNFQVVFQISRKSVR